MFVEDEQLLPTYWLLSSRYMSEMPFVEAAIPEIHTEPTIAESANCHTILTIRDWVSKNAMRGSKLDFKSPAWTFNVRK